MKLHPLHTPEMVAQCAIVNGEYFDTTRCTGRSTVQALNYIAQAIAHPRKTIFVVDHHGSSLATRELTYKIKQMVERLELQHFTIVDGAIRFG